ncbi:hypothetical protein EDC01DRAFT_786657 [Geopyxis carbonaria]|nr:hypothetical protein EDC01DRAFT_786657 [Geopyxis carbonaria]
MAPRPYLGAALDNVAVVNRVMDTVVGVWDLRPTTESAPESAVCPKYENAGAESVCGTDERTKVDPRDFMEGGKYRSIVKLFLRYEGQGDKGNWAMGTGWLIRPDLLVTAGHCSWDWTHKLGALTTVKAYIGYNGKASIPHPSCQFRQGRRVAAPAEWLKGPTRVYDVSFILLDKPFTGITPVPYADTPARGDMMLGVVGYPGDLEKGEHMFEHFVQSKFDLAENEKMLTYEVDTYGGNSGSAVMRGPNDLVAIGVHAYGGAVNKASVIGPLGNVFSDYIRALAEPVGNKTTNKGVHFVTIAPLPAASTLTAQSGAITHNAPTHHAPSRASTYTARSYAGSTGGRYKVNTRRAIPAFSYGSTLSVPGMESFGAEGEEAEDAEGFFDDFGKILKTGIKFAAPLAGNALSFATPFMGPLGAPIGVLGSLALGAAGKFAAESAFDTESFGDGSSNDGQGLAERAILGEAALQAVMRLPRETLEEEGFFEVMQSVARKLAPVVKRAAPHVLNHIMPIALGVAADRAHNNSQTESSGFVEEWPAAIPSHSQAPVRFDNQAQQNLAARLAETLGDDQEGFFTDFLSRGLAKAKPLLASAAKSGLPLLLKALEPTESSFDGAAPPPQMPTPPMVAGMADRAILQEAALQAVLHIQPEEEGFFDFMSSVIKTVGPVVMKAAPHVLKAVVPIVQRVGQAESYNGASNGNGNGNGYATGRPGLRKQKSALWNSSAAPSEGGFLDHYENWSTTAAVSTGAPRPIRTR